jgi:protein SCO1/2
MRASQVKRAVRAKTPVDGTVAVPAARRAGMLRAARPRAFGLRTPRLPDHFRPVWSTLDFTPHQRPRVRFHRLVRLAIAVALLGCFGAVAAQDLYRSAGRWIDDQGHDYRLESLYGTPAIVTMADGACRRVCSTSLRMMEQLQALAEARHERLNFVVLSLDPEADRPADWAAYRAEHPTMRANWFFLTGDEVSTRQFARRLGTRYWRYGEHVVHDLRIVRVSPQGQPLRRIDRFDQDLSTLFP